MDVVCTSTRVELLLVRCEKHLDLRDEFVRESFCNVLQEIHRHGFSCVDVRELEE